MTTGNNGRSTFVRPHRGQVPNLFASPYLRTQFPESADCTVIPNREDWVLPRQRVTDGVETTARVRHIARRRSCGLAAPGARSSRRCRLIYGLNFFSEAPLFFVIDGNVDLLAFCVDARSSKGQGLSVRRHYTRLRLHHFSSFGAGHLYRGFADHLVGACVEVGHTRHWVGLPVIEVDPENALGWVTLRIDTFIGALKPCPTVS